MNKAGNLNQKIAQFFRYLLEIKNLVTTIERDIKEYKDKVWWLSDIPNDEKCCWGEEKGSGEVWLEVYKQEIPPPPQIPEALKDWVRTYDTPEKPPEIIKVKNFLTPEEETELKEVIEKIEFLENLKNSKENITIQKIQQHFSSKQSQVSLLEIPEEEITQEESVDEILETYNKRWEELESKKEVRFDDDKERVKLWEEWFARWQKWANENLIKVRIQQFYEELFKLYQRFLREEENLELLWGHGLLTWEKEGVKIRRPLLVTKVELAFNAEEGVFTIVPSGEGTLLETDMLTSLSIPNADIIRAKESEIKEEGINPWKDEEVIKCFSEIVHALDPNGKVEYETIKDGFSVPIEPSPVIYNCPVIFVRRKTTKLWQKELKGILESLENNEEVPYTLKSLLLTEKTTFSDNQDQIEWKEILEQLLFPLAFNEEQKEIVRKLAKFSGVVVQGPPGTGKTHTIANLISHLLAHGKRILVTAKTNRALRPLLDKISENIRSLCVSVLGGDTTALKEIEKSISDIKDKLSSLDEEWLEKEIDNLRKELALCRENIASLRFKLKNIISLEEEKFEINGEFKTLKEIAKWLRENEEKHGWLPDEIAPEIKFPLTQEELNKFFKLCGLLPYVEKLELEQPRPEIDKLPDIIEIRNHFEKLESLEKQLNHYRENIADLELDLPDINKLPSPQEVSEYFHLLEIQNQKLSQLRSKIEGWENISFSADVANSLLKSVERAISELTFILKNLPEGFSLSTINNILTSNKEISFWMDIVESLKKDVAVLYQIKKNLLSYETQLPEGIPFKEIKKQLNELKEYFEKNKINSWWFKIFRAKQFRKILEECKVNGESITSSEDVEILLYEIEYKECEKRLLRKWRNVLQIEEINIADTGGLLSWFDSQVEKIDQILKWSSFVSEKIIPYIKELELNKHSCLADIDWWNKVKLWLEYLVEKENLQELQDKYKEVVKYLEDRTGIIDYLNGFHPTWDRLLSGLKKQNIDIYIAAFEEIKKLKAIRELNNQIELEKKKLDKVIYYLKNGSLEINAHETWNLLLEALNKRDINLWENCITRIETLNRKERLYKELQLLAAKLEKVAPKWTKSILRGGEGKPLTPPDDWLLAWEWKRADSFLKRFHAGETPEEIEEKIQFEKERERKLIAELVSKKVWYEQIKKVTEKQKSSLTAWFQAIKRVKKGTGKYADRWRKVARKEMANAKHAIPVWIMPVDKVIENLSPYPNQFDVIIVDESSQCDIFALTVLYRAKKAVIVGDDKQISPEPIGIEFSKIYELIDQFLKDIPHKELYELEASLYEIAERIFQSSGITMLKEHFRSVPEIIQFSNFQFYEGQIIPLRVPKPSERLEPPLVPIRVKNGYRDELKKINEPEAKAIVEKIKELCNDPKYDGKTIGVISLLGNEQASLIEDMLKQEIGEREMIRRKIVCGDAYAFQGDERDVMFLSMVVAKNVRFRALTGRKDEQRFNVAASRAKDQMWLFYSIDLDDLNPDCLRAKLLRYFLKPHPASIIDKDVEHLFESEFEKDVYQLLKAKGYAVRPQVKVGKYRIDLVVEGLHTRLAIECDGDRYHGPDRLEQDLERQAILERAGWTFFRIRASSFYRNPEKAMTPLYEKLTEMEIFPAG